ncbi:class III signal peptide-containing protein [Methanosphaera sp. WGK6]|uniref:class III signal peptide-containing protein n=1 Tax=Methanosphaera sp. WGK6 TaxID=1561964 RepID=UPI00084C9CB7|nr:class III signal peptide-containing protein [Methanosphaera sp. WGK6]OED29872.1 hypothetical protein NL43_06180 [Methanosphaera sp. WGK6]
MKIGDIDNKGQISAELILILSVMSMIVLITAYYTTSYLNEITNHTKIVIKNSRNSILSKL